MSADHSTNTVRLCECGCGQPAPIAKQTDRRNGATKGQPQRFIYGHINWVTGKPSWTMDGEKICPCCKEAKPLTTQFYRHDRRGPRGFSVYCKTCMNEKSKAWDKKHPEIARQRWRKSNRQRRAANPQKCREKDRQYQAGIKAEMVAAYGGACSCCGEAEIRFLTVEHKNKDGAAHRKKVGGGIGTWRALKKLGWPKEGYTILCWNCNCATRLDEICPHELARLRDVANLSPLEVTP